VLRRRLLALAVVGALAACGAGIGALLYFEVLAPASWRPVWPPPPSPKGAPSSLQQPFVSLSGSAGDEVAINQQFDQWTSTGNLGFRTQYFWLRCNLRGADCAVIPGLLGRTATPRQGLGTYTIRGAVTATNARGSTTVDSQNFYWVQAGIPHGTHGGAQYDPSQLRAWYGLRPQQDGSGQTIVITDFGRWPDLRAAVDHFSTHYGLPRTCGGSRARGCFQLSVVSLGQRLPAYRSGEAELDVEWAHAIAPQAKIVLVQFGHAARLFRELGRLGVADRASVVSDSWCDPCSGDREFGRSVVYPRIANGCHRAGVVCVQAAGDHGSPGDTPSNSPYVLAVGGTMFKPRVDGMARAEAPWPKSGFGATDNPLPRPSWALTVPCRSVLRASCSERIVPDVSATAAGAPTYVPVIKRASGWFVLHGTSLAAPLWAALIALTDQELGSQRQAPVGIDELHRTLYRGYASAGLDALGHHGWDKRTGWGSPKAGIVDVLTKAIERYRAGR
jgi:hypothetical protein